MQRLDELSVTLTPELYAHLAAEARALDIPLEWLVASIVVDTMDVHPSRPIAA